MAKLQFEADRRELETELPFNGASVLDIEQDAVEKALGEIL